MEGAKNLAHSDDTTRTHHEERSGYCRSINVHPSTVLLSIHTVLALLADLEKLPRTGRRVITSPLYPNTTPNFADLHPPARDKLLPFSKRLRDFLHDILFGTDMC